MTSDKFNSTLEEAQKHSEMLLQEIEGPRNLEGWQKWLLSVIAISWSLFQISLGSVLLLNSTLVRSIHLAFGLVIVYLTYPVIRSKKRTADTSTTSRRNRFSTLELIIAVLAVLAALYIALDYAGIEMRIGRPLP